MDRHINGDCSQLCSDSHFEDVSAFMRMRVRVHTQLRLHACMSVDAHEQQVKSIYEQATAQDTGQLRYQTYRRYMYTNAEICAYGDCSYPSSPRRHPVTLQAGQQELAD
jgi:hypothetical protein